MSDLNKTKRNLKRLQVPAVKKVAFCALVILFWISGDAGYGESEDSRIYFDDTSSRVDLHPHRYRRLPLTNDFERTDFKGIARGEYDRFLTDKLSLSDDQPNTRRWYKIVIHNTTSETIPVILANAITTASMYFLEGHSPEIVHLAGNYHLNDQNPFSITPASRLTLKPGDNAVYIGSHSRGNISFFMMSLWSLEAFESYEKERLIFLSVSFGAFLVIWIYNLVLYVLMRQKVYFYYVLFCSGLILIEGILGGAFLALGTEYYKSIQQYWPAAITLSLVGFALFAAEFTNVASREDHKIWFKLINSALGFTIFSTAGYYFGIGIFAKVLLLCTILVILLLTISVYKVLINSVETYYLLVSCIPLVVSSIMLILQITLVMDFNYRIIWFQLGSALLHVILVSTALGSRANFDKLEKVRLQSSIDLGRIVQEWLLPRKMNDRFENFEFAFCYVPREGSLSGDWINHWETTDGALHFVLGSVQGEKAQAALAVASIAAVIERARDLNFRVDECLKDINDTLFHLFAGRIVTTANGISVNQDGEMEFLSFDPHGWLVKRAGLPDMIMENTEILGKNGDISIRSQKLHLNHVRTAYVLSAGFATDSSKWTQLRDELSRQAEKKSVSSDFLCSTALDLSSAQKKNLALDTHDDRSMLVVTSLKTDLKKPTTKLASTDIQSA